MSSRFVVTGLSAAFLLVAWAAGADEASHHAPPPKAAAASTTAPAAASSAPSLTADEALAFLRAGNARFKAGTAQHPHQGSKRIAETAGGEHPVATILSCSDSRVPPEVLFDDGLGDIFTIRVAGNVVDTDEMGSAEYGVEHLGTSLLVVMGHTKCGAVTAVATHATVHGHIPALIEHITGAIEATRAKYPAATDTDLVPEAIRANVFQSMATLLRESEAVRMRVESGKTQVVGAIYDIDSGNVEWLGRHEDEAAIMAEGKKSAVAHDAPSHGKPAAHAPSGHDSSASHGASAAAANIAHAPKASHAPENDAEPPAPPAPSMPPPLAFVLVAVLCTIGGTISGRLTAPKA